jgi:hypothetical protein
MARIVRDNPDDAAGVVVEKADIQRGESIEVRMRPAGGFVARLERGGRDAAYRKLTIQFCGGFSSVLVLASWTNESNTNGRPSLNSNEGPSLTGSEGVARFRCRGSPPARVRGPREHDGTTDGFRAPPPPHCCREGSSLYTPSNGLMMGPSGRIGTARAENAGVGV